MIGTIGDPSVAAAVGDACGEASERIRERLGRTAAKAEQGQAGAREELFTEDLVDAMDVMDESLSESLGALAARLAVDGSNIKIEFETQKAAQGEEDDFGLDLGLRVLIKTPGYVAEKAILIQCKRMYGGAAGSGSFPKMREDGETQAEAMLTITPASFFFLFSHGPRGDLFDLVLGNLKVPPWDWYPLWGPEYYDPGVVVVPATRVLAMSRGAKDAGSPFPVGARDLLAGGMPLGPFMATLFTPCFVGDPRTPVLRLAAPPALREGVKGLDAAVPELGLMHKKTRRFQKITVTKTGSKRAD